MRVDFIWVAFTCVPCRSRLDLMFVITSDVISHSALLEATPDEKSRSYKFSAENPVI